MRDDFRPVSQVIADELMDDIDSGKLPPGALLPSERELAARYGTSPSVARGALRLLAESGAVVVEHGRGSFVRPATPPLLLRNDRYSPKYRQLGLSPFLMECAKVGKIGRYEVLGIEQVQPPVEVTERLELPARARTVLRRENIFWAGGDPVHYVTTYAPFSIAAGLGLLSVEVPYPYGVHAAGDDPQHVMARSREDVGARMPTPQEIDYLRLRPGVPVLDVWHTSIDADGRPYEVTRFVMRADLTGLQYDTPVE